MKLRLIPLRQQDAEAILDWRYEPPFDFYNPPDAGPRDQFIREFLNPELHFHAVVDSSEEMLGFCSFGLDGQVPGWRYDDSALDIGLGMHPAKTGQGRGQTFFTAILEFAREQMQPDQFRLTVARFNTRALRLYARFGFEETDRFHQPMQQTDYAILTRSADDPTI